MGETERGRDRQRVRETEESGRDRQKVGETRFKSMERQIVGETGRVRRDRQRAGRERYSPSDKTLACEVGRTASHLQLELKGTEPTSQLPTHKKEHVFSELFPKKTLYLCNHCSLDTMY